MGEEYRYRYRSDRVLLAYRQFLPDEKPGQAVFLSAAELQMLRNMAAYLHRRTTWVYLYGNEYYDGPGDQDWDMLEALVAEMELKLMPDNVRVWGYTDRLADQESLADAVAGTNTLVHTTVPAGEVWVITGGSVIDAQTAATCSFMAVLGGTGFFVYSYGTLAPWKYSAMPACNFVLKAGDYVQSEFGGCAAGDDLVSNIWGYKMAVPE